MKTLDQKIDEMRAKVGRTCGPKSEIVEDIQAAAIAVFGVDKEDFFNGCRARSVTYARMASMALCRARTGLSLNIIGMMHGGLDHACVHHAVKQSKEGKIWLTDGIKEVERLLDSSS
jgi:chromosomal replication initiation ATPase DnaA